MVRAMGGGPPLPAGLGGGRQEFPELSGCQRSSLDRSDQQEFLRDTLLALDPGFLKCPGLYKHTQQASRKGPAGSTRALPYPKVLFVLDHAQAPRVSCQHPEGRGWGLSDISKHGSG